MLVEINQERATNPFQQNPHCQSRRTLIGGLGDTVALGDGKLRASKNGRVVAVLAAAGNGVDLGQPMIVLEAMKMEHVHRAPRTGTVSLIHVVVGEQVAARRVIAEVEASVS